MLQLEDRGAGKVFGEGKDVTKVGPTKAIDALRIVADGHHVAMDRGKLPDEPGLEPVGILILIDEDVAAQGRHLPPDVLMLLEEAERAGEQVVVIHQAVALLVALVILLERQEIFQIISKLRIACFEDVFERPFSIGGRREHGVERFFARKAFFGLMKTPLRAQHIDDVGGVGGVEDGEVVLEAQLGRVATQQVQAKSMERAAAHLLAPPVEQRRSAGEHLAGGPAREGQQHDVFGLGARLDEVGHAVDERARLARTGPGNDQKRPAQCRRCGILLRVQRTGIVDRQARLRRVGVAFENKPAGHGVSGTCFMAS